MSQGVILYGETTRELYEAWHTRVGAVPTIPHDEIQSLFNDIQLYPSKSQVFEMLHCARECSQRNTDNYITFGEFCVFAVELKKYYTNHERDPSTVDSHPVQESCDLIFFCIICFNTVVMFVSFSLYISELH